MKYYNKYDNYITLTSAIICFIFPDIVKNKNTKFYYSWIDINHSNDYLSKVIILTKNANKVNNITTNIQLKISTEFIKLVKY